MNLLRPARLIGLASAFLGFQCSAALALSKVEALLLRVVSGHTSERVQNRRGSLRGQRGSLAGPWRRHGSTARNPQLRLLHTLVSVRAEEAGDQRDWIMNQVWVWTMDAVQRGTASWGRSTVGNRRRR